MDKMYTSPTIQTQGLAGFGASTSPQSPLRSEFIHVLQREQDDALFLLETNPFLSSLFAKYVTFGVGSYAARTETDPDLHDKYEALLKLSKEASEEAERVQAELRADLGRAKAACVAEKAAHAESKILLQEVMGANEKSSREFAELQGQLKELEAKGKQAELDHHAELSGMRQINEDNQQKSQREIVAHQSELSDLKTRYDVLLHIISDRDVMTQSLPLAQTTLQSSPESIPSSVSGSNTLATPVFQEADVPLEAPPLARFSETLPAVTHGSGSEPNEPIPEPEPKPIAENPIIAPQILHPPTLDLISMSKNEALQTAERAYDEGARLGVPKLTFIVRKSRRKALRDMLSTKYGSGIVVNGMEMAVTLPSERSDSSPWRR